MWAAQRRTSRSLFGRLTGVTTRSTSSGSNPYPFPTHANPSPYQIFHLPHNASQAEIKRRYIDLVRIYHPDSPVLRALPPEIPDGRFQSITKAYDALRGKTPMMSGGVQNQPETWNPKSAAWQSRQSRLDLDSGGDDRWKDGIIMFGAIFTIAVFVAEAMTTRRDALVVEMQRQGLQASRNTRTKNPQKIEDWTLAASQSDEMPKTS